jgi:hypothetical protein
MTSVPSGARLNELAGNFAGPIYGFVDQTALHLSSGARIVDDGVVVRVGANYSLSVPALREGAFLPEAVRTSRIDTDRGVRATLFAHLAEVRPPDAHQSLSERMRTAEEFEQSATSTDADILVDGVAIPGVRAEGLGMIGVGAVVHGQIVTAAIPGEAASHIRVEFVSLRFDRNSSV